MHSSTTATVFPAAGQPEMFEVIDEKMEQLAGGGHRLWYVTWSPDLTPALTPEVKDLLEERYERMKIFPGMLGHIFIYRSRPQGAEM